MLSQDKKKELEIQQHGANKAASLPPCAQMPEVTPGQHAHMDSEEKATQRTPGLKLFDFFLYPVLTNFAVFGISVGATYLTSRGGDRNAAGKLIYGETGQWFQQRGDWMVEKFKATGMTHEQADMSKMVFFSFADGSLLAPVVKMLEDRREKIACWIDDKLGTRPPNQAIYEAEPKQSWMSVLGGRLVTCSIVVPTAYTLDKTGLNDVLFSNPGRRAGEYMEKHPNIARMFGGLHIPELTKIAAFEFFYTSVCTGGLYFFSRFIADNAEKKKQEKQQEHGEEASPKGHGKFIVGGAPASGSSAASLPAPVTVAANPDVPDTRMTPDGEPQKKRALFQPRQNGSDWRKELHQSHATFADMSRDGAGVALNGLHG